MAAIHDSSSSTTTFCSHCERDIPSSNFDLHSAHCQRNLERCVECREMVPRVRAKEHYDEYHAPATCSLCEAQVSRDAMAAHEAEKCPRRVMECYYCEFPVEARDLPAHTDEMLVKAAKQLLETSSLTDFAGKEFCGSRTEMCIPCGKYVRLREKSGHDLQFHADGDDSNRMTRDYIPRGVSNSIPSNVGRRPLPESRRAAAAPMASRHKVMVTFAITGVAILIGSFVLQRRGPNQRTPQ